MNIVQIIEKGFKKLIPSPFTLAVLLSLFVLLMAFVLTGNQDLDSASTILKSWQQGMWNPALIVFMVQMMLILVLGHILVLSKPVAWLTEQLSRTIHNNLSAIIVISISTMLVAFFNWGLGLIFGAIMVRKTAEAATQRNFKINYPLLGAAGYVGLMVWHGGMSGSAPLKVAEKGHLASLFPTASTDFLARLPESIPTTETIFSSWNLLIFLVLLVGVPLGLSFISKNNLSSSLPSFKTKNQKPTSVLKGAEKLDHSKGLKYSFAFFLFAAFGVCYYKNLSIGKLTPNMLNFLMLCLCILFHRSFASFLHALDEAIGGAGAILIQFPLYFGIMGVMRDTGLVTQIAGFFVSVSNATTLPIFTFFSAGLVNIFVPSGGGQWAVQGPVVLESALKLGVPLNKMVMALAYGDQITNMLQPFWALPLLAITKLKARDILPYTLILLLIGSVIFIGGLLLIG